MYSTVGKRGTKNPASEFWGALIHPMWSRRCLSQTPKFKCCQHAGWPCRHSNVRRREAERPRSETWPGRASTAGLGRRDDEIHIYIYITELRVSSILPCCIVPRRTALRASARSRVCLSAVLRLFMDFRGFDSSIILIITGEIIVSIEDFLESLSQAILVGIMLVGRLGVCLRSVLHHATRYCSAPYHTACHCL